MNIFLSQKEIDALILSLKRSTELTFPGEMTQYCAHCHYLDDNHSDEMQLNHDPDCEGILLINKFSVKESLQYIYY